MPTRSPPSSAPSSASTLRSTEPSKTAAPTPNSTSSPKKISTQPHKDPTIVGYLHNVSPVKKSAKGSEYFSFTVQEKKKKIKALCFSPRKHKANVETKAESGTPYKLTKFTYHATEEDVIWVNAATQINHALEANDDFPCDTDNNETPVVTTKDVQDIQVYQSVTVHGMVLFGDRRAEPVPTKTDLITLVKKPPGSRRDLGRIPPGFPPGPAEILAAGISVPCRESRWDLGGIATGIPPRFWPPGFRFAPRALMGSPAEILAAEFLLPPVNPGVILAGLPPGSRRDFGRGISLCAKNPGGNLARSPAEILAAGVLLRAENPVGILVGSPIKILVAEIPVSR